MGKGCNRKAAINTVAEITVAEIDVAQNFSRLKTQPPIAKAEMKILIGHDQIFSNQNEMTCYFLIIC